MYGDSSQPWESDPRAQLWEAERVNVAAPKVLAGGHSMELTGQANQEGEGTGLEMKRGQDKVRHLASQSPPLRTRER